MLSSWDPDSNQDRREEGLNIPNDLPLSPIVLIALNLSPVLLIFIHLSTTVLIHKDLCISPCWWVLLTNIATYHNSYLRVGGHCHRTNSVGIFACSQIASVFLCVHHYLVFILDVYINIESILLRITDIPPIISNMTCLRDIKVLYLVVNDDQHWPMIWHMTNNQPYWW